MKKSSWLSASLMLATLTLTACQTTPIISTKTPTSSTIQKLSLTEGQTVLLKDKGLTLTFDKVVSDSRCPTGVQCIWAGNATIALTVKSQTTTAKTLALSIGDLRGDLVPTSTVAGYDITLENLSPMPSTNSSSNKYVAALTVSPTLK